MDSLAIGPATGTLTLHTGVEGKARRAGVHGAAGVEKTY